jgi:ACS family allantoate permease-like MFS transporter
MSRTGPTIIAGFGYNAEEATLLSMAPGGAAVVGIGAAWLVAKYTNRTIGGLFPLMLSCIGVIMMFAIPDHNYAARYGGYILTLQCKSLFCLTRLYITPAEPNSSDQRAVCCNLYDCWCCRFY